MSLTSKICGTAMRMMHRVVKLLLTQSRRRWHIEVEYGTNATTIRRRSTDHAPSGGGSRTIVQLVWRWRFLFDVLLLDVCLQGASVLRLATAALGADWHRFEGAA